MRRTMAGAPELLLGQTSEPAFNLVNPGRVRRSEVKMEAWVGLKPPLHPRSLVRRQIVENDIHVEIGWNFILDDLEELNKLDTAVPGAGLSDHLARSDIERCKQIQRSVSVVVVGAALRLPWTQR